jgi:Protein of unknown function (DUF2637)
MNDSALRKLAGAAVLLVAAIAATVSYLHIYTLALALGQPELAAFLMPLSVDGAVGAASVALLAAARSGCRSHWTAGRCSRWALAAPWQPMPTRAALTALPGSSWLCGRVWRSLDPRRQLSAWSAGRPELWPLRRSPTRYRGRHCGRPSFAPCRLAGSGWSSYRRTCAHSGAVEEAHP